LFFVHFGHLAVRIGYFGRFGHFGHFVRILVILVILSEFWLIVQSFGYFVMYITTMFMYNVPHHFTMVIHTPNLTK